MQSRTTGKWSQQAFFTLQQLKEGQVRFVHDGDESTHLTLTFEVVDPVQTAPHEDQFDIHINNVNDAPTSMSYDLGVNEGEVAHLNLSMFVFADDDTLNDNQHENYRTIDYNRDFTDEYKDYDTDEASDKHDTPDAYKTDSGIGPFDEADPYNSKATQADVQDDDDTHIADWDRFEAIRFTYIPGSHISSTLLYLRPWDHLGEVNAKVTMTVPEGETWQVFGNR